MAAHASCTLRLKAVLNAWLSRYYVLDEVTYLMTARFTYKFCSLLFQVSAVTDQPGMQDAGATTGDLDDDEGGGMVSSCFLVSGSFLFFFLLLYICIYIF